MKNTWIQANENFFHLDIRALLLENLSQRPQGLKIYKVAFLKCSRLKQLSWAIP